MVTTDDVDGDDLKFICQVTCNHLLGMFIYVSTSVIIVVFVLCPKKKKKNPKYKSPAVVCAYVMLRIRVFCSPQQFHPRLPDELNDGQNANTCKTVVFFEQIKK